MNISRRDFSLMMAAGVTSALAPKLAFAAESGGAYPADFMEIHDGLISVDGASPMLSWGMDMTGAVDDPSGKAFDYYIEGRMTATAASISTGRVTLDQVKMAVGFFDNIIEKRGFVKIRSAEDLRRAKREKKFATWYHMQSSNCVEDDLDALEGLKKAGVGQLQPTYNFQNRFANGSLERLNSGLSKAGIDLVKKCNELKIIVDGAHQGDQDILDLIEFSDSPVIVSHANARAVYNHPRNIPDEVIKAVAANGGFVGVNGWPSFVSASQYPTFDQFFAHIDHMVQLVGPDHVAIGMDYFQLISGIVPDEEVMKIYNQFIDSGAWTVEEYSKPPFSYPTGIETPKALFNITGELLQRGYSKEDVAKIWGGNWLRVMGQVWG